MGGLQIAPSGEREKTIFLADEVTNFLRKMADPFLDPQSKTHLYGKI